MLGTMEELPKDYRNSLESAGVTPLWPMMRKALPYGAPEPGECAGLLDL